MSAELHFFESDEIPRPKEQVEIASLAATPYADGRRVKLRIGLTPFFKRPNLDIEVIDASGLPVATMNVIEALEKDMELTLHLRAPEAPGEYTVRAALFFGEEPPQHTLETTFRAVLPLSEN